MVSIEDILETLKSEFSRIQAQFKTISIVHLKDLHKDLTTWRQEGLISEKFYEQNYSQFIFHPPQTLSNARFIIIIGVPQKVSRIEFFNNGKRYQTIIPPTYRFTTVRTACKDILSKVLGKKGYSVDRALVPLKLLESLTQKQENGLKHPHLIQSILAIPQHCL